MGDFLLSWLLVPLELCALSLGSGLLIAAIAGRAGAPRAEPFPGILVLPVGFAGLIVLSSLLTTWQATAPLAGVAPAVVAFAGLVIGRHRLGGWWSARRGALWPLLAAAMPAASVSAPVLLTGQAGFTGFAKITDLAHQFAFSEWLRTEGRASVGVGDSSYEEIVDKLVGSKYPGGTQSVVATMADLGHVDVAWAYQPVIAFVAAMLGVALYAVLRRAIPWRPACAIAAGVAAQPTILYAYALAAGVKELSGAAAIVLAAAVFAQRAPLGWSTLVPGAVALAAGYSIFNLTIVPWLGVLVVVMAAFELLREGDRVRTVARWAGVVALTAVLAAPAVAGALTLLRSAGGAAGPEGLGNLAAPVPAWSAVGPWITSDHRYPLDLHGHPVATYALVAVALVLVAAGVAAAIRAADLGLLALAIASVVALAFILRSSGTWVQLKAFCMIAPIALAFAFAGAAALARRERLLRIAGLGAAIAVAGGVLFGNALQYHTTTLGDYDRMIDLKRINARYAGQGPTLFPNFDEFGEYFLRDVRASGMVNPWRSVLAYNRTAVKTDVQVRDTDEYDHGFLQDFRLIIRRRDPTASRPPGNYRLAENTREYAIWKQVSDPRQIAAHHPLDGRRPTRSESFCRRARDSVERAGAGARIRYAVPPSDVVSVAAPVAATPAQWGRVANTTTLLAGAPGRLNLRVRIPRTGTYRVSMIASVGRTVTVSIDWRRVGALRWRESYPGQYNPLSAVRLTRGIHRVQVVRKGGDLLPGTGNDASGRTTLVGPLAFEPTTRRDIVRTVPGSELASLCASTQRLDWIEVLRPARA